MRILVIVAALAVVSACEPKSPPKPKTELYGSSLAAERYGASLSAERYGASLSDLRS
jgi:hypothetical protein